MAEKDIGTVRRTVHHLSFTCDVSSKRSEAVVESVSKRHQRVRKVYSTPGVGRQEKILPRDSITDAARDRPRLRAEL